MKNWIFIIFVLIGMFFSNENFAQKTNKKSIIERNVAGTTYIIETYDKFAYVENKNRLINELIKKNKKHCEGNFIIYEENEFFESERTAVKSVLTKEKINQLLKGSNGFGIRCVCNRLGEIKAVAFMNIDTSLITLEEIKSLEDNYLKLKIKINNSACSETEYFYFMSRIRYKVLLDE